jgi:hypothetical protein
MTLFLQGLHLTATRSILDLVEKPRPPKVRVENLDQKQRLQSSRDVPGVARSAVDDAQNMISERAEEPSPAALLEPMPFSPELLANGDKELFTGHERQNARVDHRLDNMFLPAGHLRQVETALEVLESQLHAPSLAIQYANVGSRSLVDGEVGDVEVVLLLLLVANPDKAKTLTTRVHSSRCVPPWTATITGFALTLSRERK